MLFDGRRLRALTVVDAFTRKALAIDVDQGIKGEHIAAAIRWIAVIRGAPRTIRVDNGQEFNLKALDHWTYENGATLEFSQQGKPTENAFVGSFKAHWFRSLADARGKIEACWWDYTETCSHTLLGWLTPVEYTGAALRLAQNERRFPTPGWMRNRGTLSLRLVDRPSFFVVDAEGSKLCPSFV
ncbi:hypothetical protein GCM10011404_30470 [Sphingomonas prati]|uniref:Putative transposase n=1 Tax=Sphingomonas prati TaxID=1843237 RepID=A0A7W9BVW5_9SPHN|nr:putative transposase [Sphingomonas prati]GGE95233.1 hypothetical protein GCM10011404_30470 [Sphingomonas prati]